MASIGFLPTGKTVEVRDPDGDAGTIPSATARSAGVMTAQHVQMLEEIFTWFLTNAGSGAPVVIERSADMSQYLTKLEARQLLTAIPRAMDMTPEIQRLRGEVMALHDQIGSQSMALLPSPERPGEVVDQTARTVLESVITQFESLDRRLRYIEATFDGLRAVAERKGAA